MPTSPLTFWRPELWVVETDVGFLVFANYVDADQCRLRAHKSGHFIAMWDLYGWPHGGRLKPWRQNSK